MYERRWGREREREKDGAADEETNKKKDEKDRKDKRDRFPRRSSPTSDWSSDTWSLRRKEVVAEITLQPTTIPQLHQHFLSTFWSSFIPTLVGHVVSYGTYTTEKRFGEFSSKSKKDFYGGLDKKLTTFLQLITTRHNRTWQGAKRCKSRLN